MKRNMTVQKICDALGLAFVGPDVEIQGLFLYGRNTEYASVLSYSTAPQWVTKLLTVTQVRAAVVSEQFLQELTPEQYNRCTWILSAAPETTFYGIHDYLIDHTDFYESFDFEPTVGQRCSIHPMAVIEKGVRIGNDVAIGPFTVIRSGTVIGDHVTIGPNCVIGEEGFQVLRANGVNRKIRHCGQTVLEDHVEVGALNAIHRSLFEGATRIGRNAKLDTKIYVGHNCLVGSNAVITAGVVLCGSSAVEDGAWLGPNSSVLNKITVGKNSMIGMGSVVTRSIPADSLAYGVPARVK